MAYNVKKHGEERTGLLDNSFPLDEDDETALLEASTGFSVLDEEDEVVSEELAEIYLAQGLRDEALAIYRKLSLRNPEKSVYFAELIGKIETNN